MNSKFLLPVFFSLLLITANAQNADYKSVKTSYLNFPVADMSMYGNYTISVFPEPNTLVIDDLKLKRSLKDKLQSGQDKINGAVDYNYLSYKDFNPAADNADLAIEIAFGKFEVVSKAMREYKIPCTLKGQDPKLDNIKECPAYYYLVTYSMPSVLKIRDKNGKIIYMEHKNENDSISFGYSEMSGHLQVSKLDEAYNQPTTASNMAKTAMKSRVERSIHPVQQIISFYKEDEKLEIATGSGKGLDYTELNATQISVVDALSNYKKSGTDPSAALNAAIKVWDKELATTDLNNKQARINRKIAVGLQRNKVIAFLYLYDFANADKSMSELNKTFAGMFNQSDKDELAKLEEKLARRKKSETNYNSNKILLKNTATEGKMIVELMMTETKNAPFNPVKSGAKYPEFKSDYEKWSGTTSSGSNASNSASTSTDAFASSILNMASSGGSAENKDYKSRVANGTLKMFPFAGDSYTTLPLEVCNLTELTELYATGMDAFTTIPTELGNLVNLKKLNLYSNSNLKAIPSSIGKLTKLELLDISGCTSLTDLPKEITYLTSLKKIIVKGSGLSASRIEELKAVMPNCKIK